MTRVKNAILVILDVIGLVTCGYGLWFQYAESISSVAMFYCHVWYILGAISHLLGLISISLENPDVELQAHYSETVLQYHYLTSWLELAVGYPLMVHYAWIILNPVTLAYLHIILSIIPVITWMGQARNWSFISQVCTTVAATSHFIICFMNGDLWGWTSAVVMVANVIALSIPTSYHVWVFNSKELFTIGLLIAGILIDISTHHILLDYKYGVVL